MKRVRFATFTWLILIPIFAIVKIIWEINTLKTEVFFAKPFPISWLDTQYPLNIFIGIGFILLATYLTFAYINAFISIQTTYAIALFSGILTLLSYTPELTSSLFATLFYMYGVLQLFSLDEKQKRTFIVFDSGFFIGIALILEVHLLVLAVLLSIFLFLFRFSFREFLQYWAGFVIPSLFIFPALYFFNCLPEWERYFRDLPKIFNKIPALTIADYVLLGILFIFSSIQILNLLNKLRKPSERLLIFFLFIYFIISLLIGLLAYPIPGAYLLFIIPSLTILYSLSKHENHKIPILLIIFIACYLIWQVGQQQPTFT